MPEQNQPPKSRENDWRYVGYDAEEKLAEDLLESAGIPKNSLSDPIKRIKNKIEKGRIPSAAEAAVLREVEKFDAAILAGGKAEEAAPEEPEKFARIMPVADSEIEGDGKKTKEATLEKIVSKLPPLREPAVRELSALRRLTAEEKEIILEREGAPEKETRMKEFDEVELARLGAEITLSKITNYEELNAKTAQEGDEKFLHKTRELWKEFAVHGLIGYDEQKNITLTNETDNDGRGCLLLMQLAGFNTSNLKYLEHEDYSEDRIFFDMGGVLGIVLKEGGKKVFIDHHTDKSGKNSSATKFTYELLKSLGLLEGERQLDNLVEFITRSDNKTYSRDEESFRNSWRTVYGLQRYLDFPKIVELFRAGINPNKILSKEDLKKHSLEEASRRQGITVRESVKHMQRIEKTGLIVASERFGKIAVDIGKRVSAGYDAARAFGCQTYLIWSPKTKSFFITSEERLDNEKISQGKSIRGHMWIKPRNGELLKIKLADVLNSLTDGKFKPSLKLKEYIEKEYIEEEGKETEIKKIMNPEELKIIEEYAKDFYNKLENGASWEGYNHERKKDTLRIQTEVFLMSALEGLLAADKAEKVVGFLIGKIAQ